VWHVSGEIHNEVRQLEWGRGTKVNSPNGNKVDEPNEEKRGRALPSISQKKKKKGIECLTEDGIRSCRKTQLISILVTACSPSRKGKQKRKGSKIRTSKKISHAEEKNLSHNSTAILDGKGKKGERKTIKSAANDGGRN